MKIKNQIRIICSSLTIALAISGMLGYFSGLEILGSFKKSYIPMAPTTAFAFAFLGATLLLTGKTKPSKIKFWLSLTTVLLVMLFGILDVSGYFTGLELHFENALIPEAGTLNGIPIGRMSPVTGFTFFLSGFSILFLLLVQHNQKKNKHFSFFSGVLNFTVFLIAFVFCLAYLLGSPLLYATEATIPMALTTSLGSIFLSLSVFSFNTNSFPLKLVAVNTMRSYLLRYILPLVVLSVFLGGIIVHFSFQLIPVNPAFLSAAAILLVIIAAGIVANYISRHLGSVIDGQKDTIIKSEQALVESEEQYRILFETMAQGVVYQNATGEIIDVNSAAERILGLSLEQMKGRTSIDPRWKAVDQDKNELPGEKHPAMIALQSRKAVESFVQGIFNPKQNGYVWILVNSIPQFRKGNDEPYQVYSTFLDLTKRKQAEDELRKFKVDLELKILEKTNELNERIKDLEQFHDATIERELRMEELRKKIKEFEKTNEK